MKTVFILLTLWLCNAFESQAQIIADKCDRFMGACYYLMEIENVGPFEKMTVLHVYKAKDNSSDFVALNFVSSSSEWKYLGNYDTYLLVDGKPMELKSTHDGDVGRGYVIEFITANISVSQFQRIAGAKTVEIKIGLSEFALTPKQQQALQTFAIKISQRQ